MTDILDTLASLPAGPYSDKDKYSDFRKVFGTPEGQRVMREILAWCQLFKPSIQASPIDPYLVTMKEGARNIGLRLLTTYHNEPAERADKARRKA